MYQFETTSNILPVLSVLNTFPSQFSTFSGVPPDIRLLRLCNTKDKSSIISILLPDCFQNPKNISPDTKIENPYFNIDAVDLKKFHNGFTKTTVPLSQLSSFHTQYFANASLEILEYYFLDVPFHHKWLVISKAMLLTNTSVLDDHYYSPFEIPPNSITINIPDIKNPKLKTDISHVISFYHNLSNSMLSPFSIINIYNSRNTQIPIIYDTEYHQSIHNLEDDQSLWINKVKVIGEHLSLPDDFNSQKSHSGEYGTVAHSSQTSKHSIPHIPRFSQDTINSQAVPSVYSIYRPDISSSTSQPKSQHILSSYSNDSDIQIHIDGEIITLTEESLSNAIYNEYVPEPKNYQPVNPTLNSDTDSNESETKRRPKNLSSNSSPNPQPRSILNNFHKSTLNQFQKSESHSSPPDSKSSSNLNTLDSSTTIPSTLFPVRPSTGQSVHHDRSTSSITESGLKINSSIVLADHDLVKDPHNTTTSVQPLINSSALIDISSDDSKLESENNNTRLEHAISLLPSQITLDDTSTISSNTINPTQNELSEILNFPKIVLPNSSQFDYLSEQEEEESHHIELPQPDGSDSRPESTFASQNIDPYSSFLLSSKEKTGLDSRIIHSSKEDQKNNNRITQTRPQNLEEEEEEDQLTKIARVNQEMLQPLLNNIQPEGATKSPTSIQPHPIVIQHSKGFKQIKVAPLPNTIPLPHHNSVEKIQPHPISTSKTIPNPHTPSKINMNLSHKFQTHPNTSSTTKLLVDPIDKRQSNTSTVSISNEPDPESNSESGSESYEAYRTPTPLTPERSYPLHQSLFMSPLVEQSFIYDPSIVEPWGISDESDNSEKPLRTLTQPLLAHRTFEGEFIDLVTPPQPTGNNQTSLFDLTPKTIEAPFPPNNNTTSSSFHESLIDSPSRTPHKKHTVKESRKHKKTKPPEKPQHHNTRHLIDDFMYISSESEDESSSKSHSDSDSNKENDDDVMFINLSSDEEIHLPRDYTHPFTQPVFKSARLPSVVTPKGSKVKTRSLSRIPTVQIIPFALPRNSASKIPSLVSNPSHISPNQPKFHLKSVRKKRTKRTR